MQERLEKVLTFLSETSENQAKTRFVYYTVKEGSKEAGKVFWVKVSFYFYNRCCYERGAKGRHAMPERIIFRTD